MKWYFDEIYRSEDNSILFYVSSSTNNLFKTVIHKLNFANTKMNTLKF